MVAGVLPNIEATDVSGSEPESDVAGDVSKKAAPEDAWAVVLRVDRRRPVVVRAIQ